MPRSVERKSPRRHFIGSGTSCSSTSCKAPARPVDDLCRLPVSAVDFEKRQVRIDMKRPGGRPAGHPPAQVPPWPGRPPDLAGELIPVISARLATPRSM